MTAPLVITGFAARTDIRTELTDGVFETIKPGAFKRSINNPHTDVIFSLQHGSGGSGLPLARTTAGSLKLSEVTGGPMTGLWVEATLDPDDPDAQLLDRKLRSGALDGRRRRVPVPKGRADVAALRNAQRADADRGQHGGR